MKAEDHRFYRAERQVLSDDRIRLAMVFRVAAVAPARLFSAPQGTSSRSRAACPFF